MLLDAANKSIVIFLVALFQFPSQMCVRRIRVRTEARAHSSHTDTRSSARVPRVSPGDCVSSVGICGRREKASGSNVCVVPFTLPFEFMKQLVLELKITQANH